MHRSGTSLAASLIQALGVQLPGHLIKGDIANPTGYFESSDIVDAQEELLKQLGYWWPTERASRGMPATVVAEPSYRSYVAWLAQYLPTLMVDGVTQIAIKDPRTTLLLPAWREVADQLGIGIKVLVCLRDPRDVCWSLVTRDGSSVGMSWSRAQRLWLEHYSALISNLSNLHAKVVLYEDWLERSTAEIQIRSVAKFLGCEVDSSKISNALQRIVPELNHGGIDRLPSVHGSLRALHHRLARSQDQTSAWVTQARRSRLSLKLGQRLQALRERLHVAFLQVPFGHCLLGHVLDRDYLFKQLGSRSLRSYFESFPLCDDLRPHPLISPAHINQERLDRGLPLIKTAGELFLFLLYPDLLPLDPHPWFSCHYYQKETNTDGVLCRHPVIDYLNLSQERRSFVNTHPGINHIWLRALGARVPEPWLMDSIPASVRSLHPGLVMDNPIRVLGSPEDGEKQLVANETYWRNLAAAFLPSNSSEPDEPLEWIQQQPRCNGIGLIDEPLASGFSCWWLSGDWEAPLMSSVCGADSKDSRCFSSPEMLFQAIKDRSFSQTHLPLIALTEPLFELLHAEPQVSLVDVAVLNLMWPRPSQRSAWLHQIIQCKTIIEFRSPVRAYLRGLGMDASWQRSHVSRNPQPQQSEMSTRNLLLSLSSGSSERQLSQYVELLNPSSYAAYLRLDQLFQAFGEDFYGPSSWLVRHAEVFSRWYLLEHSGKYSDTKQHALLSWIQYHNIDACLIDSGASPNWMHDLCRPRTL